MTAATERMSETGAMMEVKMCQHALSRMAASWHNDHITMRPADAATMTMPPSCNCKYDGSLFTDVDVPSLDPAAPDRLICNVDQNSSQSFIS